VVIVSPISICFFIHLLFTVHMQHGSKEQRMCLFYPQICINILQMPYLLFTPYHIMYPRISPPRPKWRQVPV